MNLKPYPKYKDSGIQWIGKIPEGWKNFRLKHVINEFIAGGTPSSDNEKFWAQSGDKGIPWVKIGDMTNKEIIKDTAKKITKEGLADKRLRILKKGTLIYSIFASLGKISMLGIDATTNQAILGLITNKKIDNNFLKYYLRNLEEPIIILSNANTQNNLNSTIVKNVDISIPEDKKDQTAIANFLDKKTAKIDAMIEKDKKLIALLKEKRTALINHAVTKGLDPNVKLKDSGIEWIGKIPEGWEVRRLRFNALVNPSGKKALSDPKLLVNFLPMEKVSENGEYDTESKADYQDVSSGYTYFENKDVLVAKITPCFENGKGALVMDLKYGFGFGTTEFHVLRSRDNLQAKYLFYLTKTYLFRVTGEAFMEGTAGQKRVSADFIKDFLMVTPPKPEQQKIVEYLDKATSKIDKTIQKIQNKIELLEEYKKSLIHYVVTGKVDVRGVEA